MIGNSLLTQIITAAIAVGIVITYIQPQFGEIKNRQDEIAQTRDEVKKVADVNARLAELYAQLSAIPQRDKAALVTYLPDLVDEVQVLKDLTLITGEVDVELQQVAFAGEAAVTAANSGNEIHEWTFQLSFGSSYEKAKQVLAFLERNHYPLVVKEMNVSPADGGNLMVDLTLNTYSLNGKE